MPINNINNLDLWFLYYVYFEKVGDMNGKRHEVRAIKSCSRTSIY